MVPRIAGKMVPPNEKIYSLAAIHFYASSRANPGHPA
jgi:hypothetical protein